MIYADIKFHLEDAVKELTLDSIGRAIAEVTDAAGARAIMTAIERHSGAGLL